MSISLQAESLAMTSTNAAKKEICKEINKKNQCAEKPPEPITLNENLKKKISQGLSDFHNFMKEDVGEKEFKISSGEEFNIGSTPLERFNNYASDKSSKWKGVNGERVEKTNEDGYNHVVNAFVSLHKERFFLNYDRSGNQRNFALLGQLDRARIFDSTGKEINPEKFKRLYNRIEKIERKKGRQFRRAIDYSQSGLKTSSPEVKLKSQLHLFLGGHPTKTDKVFNSFKELIAKQYAFFVQRTGVLPVFHSEPLMFDPRNLNASFNWGFDTKLREELDKAISKHTYKGEVTPPARIVSKLKGRGCFQSERDAWNFANNEDNLTLLRKAFTEKSSVLKEKFVNCHPEVDMAVVPAPYKEFRKKQKLPLRCSANFGVFYEDNMTTPSEKLEDSPEFTEFKKCVATMKIDGVKLLGVSVNSSSSQLNNTDENDAARSNHCAKGFLELSEARSKSMIEFLKDPKNGVVPSARINPNNKGQNENGSSGACPYYLNKYGKEVIKEEYDKEGSKRSELDKAKYTKVVYNYGSVPVTTKQKQRKIDWFPCYYVKIIGCKRLHISESSDELF